MSVSVAKATWYNDAEAAGVELIEREGSEEIFRQKSLDLIERCWHEW